MLRHVLHAILLITLVSPAGPACDGTELPKDDASVGPDQAVADAGGEAPVDAGGPDQSAPDQTVDLAPDTQATKSLTVAAIQCASEDVSQVNSCSDDLCAVDYLVKQAVQNGADLVVLPLGCLGQTMAVMAPTVGTSTASSLPAGLIKTLATLADQQNVTLVFAVTTQEGTGVSAKVHSSVIVADAAGAIIAMHHKFQLYLPAEIKYTEGASLATSFFNTPAGKVGLLNSADVQCIVVNMDDTKSSCTTHAVNMLTDFFNQKPDIVVHPNFWMAKGTQNPIWQILAVAAKVAKDHGVWFVEANHTEDQFGLGGGIWKPDGIPLVTSSSGTPNIVYGDIPY